MFFIALAVDLIVGCHWGIGVPNEFLTLTDLENAVHVCFIRHFMLYADDTQINCAISVSPYLYTSMFVASPSSRPAFVSHLYALLYKRR